MLRLRFRVGMVCVCDGDVGTPQNEGLSGRLTGHQSVTVG
jgi:hypothetical protein